MGNNLRSSHNLREHYHGREFNTISPGLRRQLTLPLSNGRSKRNSKHGARGAHSDSFRRSHHTLRRMARKKGRDADRTNATA